MPEMLAYASPATPALKPTKHSWLAAASWIVYIASVAYDKTIVYLAYRSSPTYPWERFERNVGPQWLLYRIWWWIAVVGAILAIAALLHPFRKRWAAWMAWGLNFFMISTMIDTQKQLRVSVFLLTTAGAIAIVHVIQRRARKQWKAL